MTETALPAARLIGLDWGSTGLRAFLIGMDGQVLAERHAALGASVLKNADDYAHALRQLANDWMQTIPDLPLLACGMVGSKHGWQEAPYVTCSAGAAELVQALQRVAGTQLRTQLYIVPGLLCEPGAPPDVMRGEETQIVGALRLRPGLTARSCVVLPGTHSKWADIREGQVCGFATHMTGELFAVLRQHSIVGRLMDDVQGEQDAFAFLQGVDAARTDGGLGLTHQLFAVRTLGLTEKIPGSGLADYLSGLLIGHELRAGLAWRAAHMLADAPLALVGEPALCRRYAQALERFGHTAELLPNTAPAGLWQLALAGGLATSSPNV